jgi:hypothetical protein
MKFLLLFEERLALKYDFTKRERDFGRIVFALMLDRKKMTERVIIGQSG